MCVLAAIVLGGAYVVYQHERTKINRDKITKLVQNDDCKKGLQELSAVKPNPKKPVDTIALLSYQSTCLLRLGHYDKAIISLQELRGYHLKINDKVAVSLTDSNITYTKDRIANPPKKQLKDSSPVDPELEQGLDSLRTR